MPMLFRDRTRPAQVALGGAVPFALGALEGVLLGIASGAYWGFAALAAIGAVLAGLEHRDGWGGADRGLVGGALFGLGMLLAHAIAGTHAKVSLGGFPPLVIVIDAIAGMFLGALGGRVARYSRERNQPNDTELERERATPRAQELPDAGAALPVSARRREDGR
jgi:hypothetical protein